MASDFMPNKKILFFRQTVPLAYLSYFTEHLLFFLNKCDIFFQCFFLDCSSNVKIFAVYVCHIYLPIRNYAREKSFDFQPQNFCSSTTTKGIDHHNHTCRLLKNINILRG